MKFIILSDIHGNIYALKECFKYIEKMNFDAIIWCGDYITDIPKGHEVLEAIRFYSKKYKSYIIKGNREEYVLQYANNEHKNWKINTRYENIVYTYKALTKEDIKWIESLPKNIEIELEYVKIYVTHKLPYEQIDKCKYKIFGHSHKQYNFTKDGVKYINPGSIGLNTDGIAGTQFSTLEITDKYEKIEEYNIQYNIQKPINLIKKYEMNNKGYRWGELIIKTIETGIDYPQKCIIEYNKIKNEHNNLDESIEIWNKALDNAINKL